MKTLVVLPSYNEADNLTDLMKAILALSPDYSVCVVDDNSPDGTSKKVEQYISKENLSSRAHLIVREKKDGRGGAVRDGIRWGIDQGDYDLFVEMDCDFSHPPQDLVKGCELLKTNDVVMGARYPNGKIVGWPLQRKVLSFFANLLARFLISWKIHDYTNGYRFYTKRAAKLLVDLPQRHKGYIYLSETLAHFLIRGFKIESFPILFINRKRGVSNTSFSEVFKSLTAIFEIGRHYRRQKSQA